MNNNQQRGLVILISSIVALIFALQLPIVPAKYFIAFLNFLMMTLGILMLSKRVDLIQKPFSIVSFGIGFSIAIIFTIFFLSLKNGEKSKERRQTEMELQKLNKKDAVTKLK